ncbi:hypothetical protein WAF17_12810 [Bernardetia sp. ABR2-2B]|uniref:hypothetical protein n=1 Tax=Bernardetia sp. ABR2-2B TaxID=3127472 RepID=UPI0030CB8450
MDIFRNSFLLLVLFCILFIVKSSCIIEPPEPQKSLVKKIAKSWKISTLTVDNNPIFEIDGFTLKLNQNDDQPTTYMITTGGLEFSFAPSISGNWSLDNNKKPSQANFDENTVDFTVFGDKLTIIYNKPATDNKPESVLHFVLVPK